MKSLVLSLALCLALPMVAAAQKGPPMPQPRGGGEPNLGHPQRKAPAIAGRVVPGDNAPTFELDASTGRSVKLTSLRGGWLVLVIADRWQQIAPLKEIQDEMRELGAQVVGLCHEKAHTLIGVASREKLPILLLADVTGQVSALYGLFDYGRSESQPGCLIIDPRGVVQLTLLGQHPPPETIARLARFAITGL